MLVPAAASSRGEKEIVRIHSGKQWRVNDSVCFHRGDEIVACGKVVGTTSYLVAIRVPSLHDKVKKGERLFVAASGPGRQPSSYGDSYLVTRTTPLFLHAVTLGWSTSTFYLFPTVHVQAGIGRGWLVGLMPAYASKLTNGTSVNVLGTYATGEAFFGGAPFDGFSFQFALGLLSIKSGTASSWTPTTQGALGWRFVTHGGFTMGLGAGGQYTFSTATPNTSQLTGLQPLFRADIGWAF